MRAVLKAQINKMDRNDARAIAQMMRVGLYRPVHLKTPGGGPKSRARVDTIALRAVAVTGKT